jgi:hypothetical protein
VPSRCCDCACNDPCPGNPDPEYLDHYCWVNHGHEGDHYCQCGNTWPQEELAMT